MALPELYWLLACPGCGARVMVYDTWLEEIGIPGRLAEDGVSLPPSMEYGPSLIERIRCPTGCTRSMGVIGSLWSPTDPTMQVSCAYAGVASRWEAVDIALTDGEVAECERLIHEPGYLGSPSVLSPASVSDRVRRGVAETDRIMQGTDAWSPPS